MFSVHYFCREIWQENANVHERANNSVDKMARDALKSPSIQLYPNKSSYDYLFQNNMNYVDVYYRQRQRDPNLHKHSKLAEHDLLLQIKPSNQPLNEMRLINLSVAKLINQLRMGYNFDAAWQLAHSLACTCDPNIHPTIEHFIYHCPQYNAQREIFKTSLIDIEPLYQDDNVFSNLQSLLFPHTLYTFVELKEKENLVKRCGILQAIYLFCKHRWPPPESQ